ncbi:peptidylprolyl isomerase [Corynebacterium testudinoris]|uniref:Peptidyl-prolyl cis-trans isomerase (Rotamase)-cyclophilin family n=1 Tax=Corynebacterium testudinoris TaxID=136857 RepID=A0A0G3H6B2_9CORY|nr:peptidylprolyl isomerase [Corynebacterium testudinoris]AKK08914.1 peptidyl-prolyl cis-trans isomerase (rotamase) - cyclophilin family [Corynebacterium testudinoris]MBX8994969.1 peptidylprolyl isomerase [Corynebacterium testudinoris]
MTNQNRGEEALAKLDREIKSRDRAEKSKPLKVSLAAAAVILALVGGIWYLATQNGDEEATTASESTAPTTAEAPEMEPLAMVRTTPLADTVTCTYEPAGDASREVSTPTTENVPATGTVTVTLATNKGDIGMELDRSVSPCTVNAVEHLAEQGYYNDTVCHRLTTSGIHVLQCGDPSGSGAGGPGFQFANEYPTDETDGAATSPVIYPRGSIAMANAGAGTNGSQFFLNYLDSPLAPDYTYFGQISEGGLKVLDDIAGVGVTNGAADGAPAEEVRIQTATVG